MMSREIGWKKPRSSAPPDVPGQVRYVRNAYQNTILYVGDYRREGIFAAVRETRPRGRGGDGTGGCSDDPRYHRPACGQGLSRDGWRTRIRSGTDYYALRPPGSRRLDTRRREPRLHAGVRKRAGDPQLRPPGGRLPPGRDGEGAGGAGRDRRRHRLPHLHLRRGGGVRDRDRFDRYGVRPEVRGALLPGAREHPDRGRGGVRPAGRSKRPHPLSCRRHRRGRGDLHGARVRRPGDARDEYGGPDDLREHGDRDGGKGGDRGARCGHLGLRHRPARYRAVRPRGRCGRELSGAPALRRHRPRPAGRRPAQRRQRRGRDGCRRDEGRPGLHRLLHERPLRGSRRGGRGARKR